MPAFRFQFQTEFFLQDGEESGRDLLRRRRSGALAGGRGLGRSGAYSNFASRVPVCPVLSMTTRLVTLLSQPTRSAVVVP